MNKINSKPIASSNYRHNLRGSNGRFVSNVSAPVSSTSVSVKSSSKSAVKSSFINRMTIRGKTVEVVMSRDLKTVYTYEPSQSALNAIKNALNSGTSLGVAYNQNLRNKNFEIYRTIYK